MQNFWLRKKRENENLESRQYWMEIKDNYVRVPLVWNEVYNEEMPLLREDYIEMEAAFHIYRTELEHAQGVYTQCLLKG